MLLALLPLAAGAGTFLAIGDWGHGASKLVLPGCQAVIAEAMKDWAEKNGPLKFVINARAVQRRARAGTHRGPPWSAGARWATTSTRRTSAARAAPYSALSSVPFSSVPFSSVSFR